LLKSEIMRLAKKEVRKEVAPLRKTIAVYRREIAQLKRTLASLQRATKQLAKPRATSDLSVSDGRPVRFVAKGLVSLRKRLGVSADQMARLLGVSMQSVYNWERKKATPRKEQVAAIVALRGIGKKEAHQRLDEAKAGAADKRTTKRPSKKRSPTRHATKSKPASRPKRRRAKK
jgi:DNA-binding transcriptional regulator YiaG